MIDFVRMNYKNTAEAEAFFCNEANFKDMTALTDIHTGEETYPYKTKLETMQVIVNRKGVCAMNSLHKLKNYRENRIDRNHNDFTYCELVETIDFLKSKLYNLKYSRLSRLEFALNIKTDLTGDYIIRNNIRMHNLKIRNHLDNFKGKGTYTKYDYTNYDFKIYDKAKQYNLPSNILRFEIKHNTSKSFNPMGIYTLEDLKTKDCLKKLFDDLMMRFEELTIIDDYINDETIDVKIKNKLDEYSNYIFWERLSDRKKRNKKRKEKELFQKLLEDYNLLKTKNYLRNQLKSKFEYLINN